MIRKSSNIQDTLKKFLTKRLNVTVPKEVSPKYAFMEALRPIIFPLTMVGIQPKMNPETVFSPQKSSLIRWWNVLALVYLHALSLKAIAAIALTSGGALDFWIQLTTFLRSSAATISADIYVYKQRDVQHLFRRMSHVYDKLKVEDRQGFYRRVKMGALIVWLFLAMYFVATMITVYNMEKDNFLWSNIFTTLISRMPRVTQFVLGGIFLLIQQLLMWGTLSFMIVMYIALCHGIKLSFRNFTRNLVKALNQDKIVEVNSLLKLRRHYDYLADLVTRMDDIFSPAVFFWYSSFILSVCVDITFDVTLYESVANYPLLISILKLVVLFGAYAFIGMSASMAIEESKRCIPIFYRLTASDVTWSNIQVSHSLLMFGLHLKSSQFALTGWKFFTLNRTYMMTILGVLVSYAIIVVQLNPRLMKSIITG